MPRPNLLEVVSAAFVALAFGALIVLGAAVAIQGRPAPNNWPEGWRCDTPTKRSAATCSRPLPPSQKAGTEPQ